MCNMGREIVLIWQMEVVEMRHAKGLEQDLAQRGLGNGGLGPHVTEWAEPSRQVNALLYCHVSSTLGKTGVCHKKVCSLPPSARRSEDHAAGRAGVSSGPSVLWIYSPLPSGGHAGNDAHASNSYSDAISMAFRK